MSIWICNFTYSVKEKKMTKKYLTILFFFLCYCVLPLQSSAAPQNEKNQSNLRDFFNNVEKDSNTKVEPNNTIDSDLNCTKSIPFTSAQKKRLDQIYHQIYMDYIDLIETYAWAGALTQDQKLIRYKMLRNYILTLALH